MLLMEDIRFGSMVKDRVFDCSFDKSEHLILSSHSRQSLRDSNKKVHDLVEKVCKFSDELLHPSTTLDKSLNISRHSDLFQVHEEPSEEENSQLPPYEASPNLPPIAEIP